MADEKDNLVPEDDEKDEDYEPRPVTPEDILNDLEDTLFAEKITRGCCDDQEKDR